MALSRLPVGSSASTIERIVGQGACEGDALLFASGELGRIVMGTSGQPDFFEKRPGASRRITGAPAISIGTATFSYAVSDGMR